MASYEIHPIPLSIVLAEVRELVSKGYDPKGYLSQLLIDDNGGRPAKL